MVEAVRHARAVQGAIRQLQTMDDDELYVYAKARPGPGLWAAQLGVLVGGWACVSEP